MSFVWPDNLYTLPLLTGATFAGLFALIAWMRRPAPGAIWASVMMTSAALWSLATIFELGNPEAAEKLFWIKVEYLGITCVTPGWFLFITRYLNKDAWLTRRHLITLWLIPTITLLLMWTNDIHHLVYRHTEIEVRFDLPMLVIHYGPWFWVFSTYAYMLTVAGIWLCGRGLRETHPLYRRQLWILLIAALVPLLSSGMFVCRLGPIPNLDFTPFTLTVSGMLAVSTLFHTRLFDLSPVARNAIFESLSDGVLVLDMRARIVDVNPAMRALALTLPPDLIGREAHAVFPWLPGDLQALATAHEKITLEHATEGERYFDVRATSLRQRATDNPTGWLLVLRDITERHHLEERLHALAYYDPLTGLPNRLLGLDRLQMALTRMARYGASAAVIFLDLDGFKEVNDTLGHSAGDRLLQEVARRLMSGVRESDTVARLGGDEFMLVLADLEAPDTALRVADRILQLFERLFIVDNHDFHVTASLGLAQAPRDGATVETLMKNADRAMYEAKARGKNTCVTFEVLGES